MKHYDKASFIYLGFFFYYIRNVFTFIFKYNSFLIKCAVKSSTEIHLSRLPDDNTLVLLFFYLP